MCVPSLMILSLHFVKLQLTVRAHFNSLIPLPMLYCVKVENWMLRRILGVLALQAIIKWAYFRGPLALEPVTDPTIDPFDNLWQNLTLPRGARVCVTGLPGIGKSPVIVSTSR